MAVTLTIPDSILEGLRLPEGEIESRLRLELAVALYSQGALSLGKAAELSQTSRFRMAEVAADRGIPRQYGEEELADDLNYARGE
jgi:predicted HTH domain antitoxin